MNKQIKESFTYIHEIERHWSDRMNDTHRDINMVEGTLSNGMDHRIDHLERAVNDQITDSVTQSNSYTDKRIDKLIDAYFEVQEVRQQSKKLIKG